MSVNISNELHGKAPWNPERTWTERAVAFAS